MSEKSAKKRKRTTHSNHHLISSVRITQMVCFAIVATAAIFGFVQARRALYGAGGGTSSVIDGDRHSKIVDDGNALDIDGRSNLGLSAADDTTSEITSEKPGSNTTKIYSDGTAVKITVSPVNIRNGSGMEYDVISNASRGMIFPLLSTAHDSKGHEWSLIALPDSKEGWILSSCCRILNESELKTTTTGNTVASPATKNAANGSTAAKISTAKSTTVKSTTSAAKSDTVVIKATPVNIRSGAGARYKVIARAKKGDSFRLLGKKKAAGGSTWYKVALEGNRTGWVKSPFCRLANSSELNTTKAESTTAKTTTKRTTAKTTTAKTTTKKTTAKTTTKTKTNAGGKSVEISVSPVNIRSGPGMNYSIITRTSRGKVYRLFSVKKNSDGKEWCEIGLDKDKRGWVLKTCCRIKDEGSDATTAKSTTSKSSTKKETAPSTTTTKAEDKLIMSIQPTEHSAKYFIVVYKGSQSVVVYGKDKNDDYTKSVKVFTCSTGKKSSPTRTGKYRIRAKYRWRRLVGNVYGQFNSSIGNDYLFHSVPYYERDASTLENEEYDKLGTPASKGCIRMCVRDCKWIYDNCAIGTDVRVVNDSGPAGPGVPKRKTASRYRGWDPSDKWNDGNPYFNNV